VVQKALNTLGYSNVEQVRIGKYLELDLSEDGDVSEQIKEMCDKLLANPIIENYRYEVIK
jgi:phosphoribosylformylglycinamidine synthase